MRWYASAPANIALIKYMGKESHQINYPINPSLSYTLPHLLTHVEMEVREGGADCWEPLNNPQLIVPTLSAQAQTRFLNHLAFIKQHFAYKGAFTVRSANNFPHGAGLASSASSFCALTQCAVSALTELTQTPSPPIAVQAQWSRQGSGSSCRSFFEPWALWERDNVSRIDLPYTHLNHQVILIQTAEKKVSSSEAHQRIKTSPQYSTRAARVKTHLHDLMNALKTQQWQTAYEICWREFQDMHELFHTCTPAFSYITSEVETVLHELKSQWKAHGDGPIVTMDAGPNIHLLYRPDQTALMLSTKQHFDGKYHVI